MALVPKTLYLGLYTDKDVSGLVGKYVKWDGTLDDEVFALAGDTWEILGQAMNEGWQHIKAKNLVIMTNDDRVVKMLNYPIGWDGYVIKDLENPHIRKIAHSVCMYDVITTKKQKEEMLQGAKELWRDLSKQHNGNRSKVQVG